MVLLSNLNVMHLKSAPVPFEDLKLLPYMLKLNIAHRCATMRLAKSFLGRTFEQCWYFCWYSNLTLLILLLKYTILNQ